MKWEFVITEEFLSDLCNNYFKVHCFHEDVKMALYYK